MNTIQAIVAGYKEHLREIRQNAVLLNELMFKESDLSDENYYRRYRILFALQYDLKQTDKEIVETLFDQELKFHKNLVAGYYPSLRLCAFLLSKFGDVRDVNRFIQAKRINFDTEMGFDREFLISAGVAATFTFLNEHKADEVQETFYQHVLPGDFTESDLAVWKTRIEGDCSKNLEMFIGDEEIRLLKELGEKELLSKKIDIWKNEMFERLSLYEEMRGNTIAELRAREMLAELRISPIDKCWDLENLSYRYYELDLYADAWKCIDIAQRLLKEFTEWKSSTLGVGFLNICVEIILKLNDKNDTIGIGCYQWILNNYNEFEPEFLLSSYKGAELIAKVEQVTSLMKKI